MFLKVEIKTVKTVSAINNPNSWKLMENLGFKRLDGTKFVKYTLLKDKVEVYVYELSRTNFLKILNMS